MAIHRGQVLAYDSTNHKADVMLLGSMSGVVLGVPVADHVPPDGMVADTPCGVMFFGEGDPGVVVCTFDGTPFNPVKDLDFDAKGDLLVGKAADDYDRLGVGSNEQVLTADSAQTLGVKWAACAPPAVPCCRVYHNTVISTANGTWTYLPFNSERYDFGGLHSTVTNNSRLTPQVAGVYTIKGSVRWGSNNTGYRGLQIRLSGTAPICVHDASNSGLGSDFLTISCDMWLNVGDYVELGAVQNSRNWLNVDSSAWDSPEFMMAKLD